MMDTPNMRFKGFAEPWKQHKLGEITVKIGSGKTPLGGESTYIDNGIPLIRSQNVNNDRVDFDDVVFIDDATDNSMVNSRVYTNDVLLNITGASIGRSAVYKRLEHANVNQHVCIIRPTNSYISDFIQLNLTSDNGQRQIESSQAGGGREGLNFQQIGKMQFMFPTKGEQERIGAYFNHLDYLITLHQRKCDEVSELKKFMLQKMFPKNGGQFPEIRFSGYTDPWEQRKFGDIAQRQSETMVSDDDNPSVEYEDVISERGTLNKDIYLKNVSKSGIKFSAEDVLYGKLRPYLHNWLNPDFTGVAVGDWWVLRPINANKNFLYRLIQTSQYDDAANQSSGTKMPRADWKLISNLEFQVPSSIDEQSQIASVFDNLDSLITLHQRKREELKDIKKFMLQNMLPQKG